MLIELTDYTNKDLDISFIDHEYEDYAPPILKKNKAQPHVASERAYSTITKVLDGYTANSLYEERNPVKFIP